MRIYENMQTYIVRFNTEIQTVVDYNAMTTLKKKKKSQISFLKSKTLNDTVDLPSPTCTREVQNICFYSGF